MSINGHRGRKHTRRDDLECVMYLVIHMLNAGLPWTNLTETETRDQNSLVLEMKESLWGPKLQAGLPPVFQKFVRIITELGPCEEPPYDYLIKLMLIVDTSDFRIKDIFDIHWNPLVDSDLPPEYYNLRITAHRNSLQAF